MYIREFFILLWSIGATATKQKARWASRQTFEQNQHSAAHTDVSVQGLKIVRVSAGDQHMGALTKEGKALPLH